MKNMNYPYIRFLKHSLRKEGDLEKTLSDSDLLVAPGINLNSAKTIQKGDINPLALVQVTERIPRQPSWHWEKLAKP